MINKDEILFERKRAIAEEIYRLIKQHPEFDIAVTINFEAPATLTKAWLITQKQVISEAVDGKGVSSITSEDLPNLDWKDYLK